MAPLKILMRSTTAIALALGAGGVLAAGPLAGDRPAAGIRLAAGPCGANPCAARGPTNPCAARTPANPCNPCMAATAATPCLVPRLVAEHRAVNPCAAKSPCGPRAARGPCNPCAAKGPCNPCAAADKAPPKLADGEAEAAYACVGPHMAAAYRRSGRAVAASYRGWARFSRVSYPADGHGARFMNNYANATARDEYGKWEAGGALPVASVLAKDSFVVADDGKVSVGPLFVMEKRAPGHNSASRDWHYEMIMPDGVVRAGADIERFCNDCHRRAGAEDDHLMFVPLPYRVSATTGR